MAPVEFSSAGCRASELVGITVGDLVEIAEARLHQADPGLVLAMRQVQLP